MVVTDDSVHADNVQQNIVWAHQIQLDIAKFLVVSV